MYAPDGYVDVNRALWDERAPAHANSPDYALGRFADDPVHLSGVVAFDRPFLGSVEGMRGIHLQCHIGTDTVSLARLGTHMTGLDFAAQALVHARRLATSAGADVDFVESEVYGALDVLAAGSFDLAYTGIGAIIWLPDIDSWAGIVAELLRPGGRIFMREGHRVLYAVADPRPDGLVVLDHPVSSGPSRPSGTRRVPTSAPMSCSSTAAARSRATASARS